MGLITVIVSYHILTCDLPGFFFFFSHSSFLPPSLHPSFLPTFPFPNIMHTLSTPPNTEARTLTTSVYGVSPSVSSLLLSIDWFINNFINPSSNLPIWFSHIYAHFLTVCCLGIFFLIYKRAPCCSQSFVFVIVLLKFHSICCLELYFIHFDCCTLFHWVHTLKWIDLFFHSSSSGNLGGLCKSSRNRKYVTRTRAVVGWRRGGAGTWR